MNVTIGIVNRCNMSGVCTAEVVALVDTKGGGTTVFRDGSCAVHLGPVVDSLIDGDKNIVAVRPVGGQ